MNTNSSLKHLLITGGAGFIGSNFVHLLLETEPNYRVTVIDKLTYAGNLKNLNQWSGHPQFQFIKMDISDSREIQKLFKENNFDGVIHFAAESHVDRSITNPDDFIHTNILGTFHLLEAIRENWKSTEGKKFLHVSTDEVFGSLGEKNFFTEDSPYSPNSPYSASKASSDHLVRAYFHTYHLPVVTSNCSNNFGSYQYPEKLIPLTIIHCIQKKPIPVYGNGKNIRDWLYVKDHCNALKTIFLNGNPGETYLIGCRNEKTNLEIVNRICEIMDQILPFETSHSSLIQYVTDRPGHDFRYAIDPSKIEKELAWTPDFNFDSSLKETIEWYIENQPWWKDIMSKKGNL
jgi:dTDP-glucose 4,6-dehydratase